MKFSAEFKHFVGSICYVMVFSCDALFFLMIDWRTQNFLKVVAASFLAYTTLCVMAICIIFAMPHKNLIEIVPVVKEILFQNKLNYLLQQKVIDLHQQMTTDNVIGISCSGVYTITNYTNLRSLILFCLNLILILNLFREYFTATK